MFNFNKKQEQDPQKALDNARSMVSRIAVPRIGDMIAIKYNPSDPSQIAVMS